MANAGAVRAGGAYIELSTRGAALEKGLRKAQRQVEQFAQKAQAAGMAMLAAGGAMAAPFALATRKGVEFTDTMAIVGAVTQATGKDFDDLNEKAKQLGATTSFTAQQIADGMVSLGRAGYNTTQILAAIPDVLDLSRATATELGMAAEIAAAAMRGFNLDASDTRRIADVLTTAANSSAQTLTDLGESLKFVAPQAMEAGETLEDTAAALAVLANNGIKGSLAGTALARAYKNLSSTSAQKQVNDLGVAVVDANGDLRNLSDILTELGQKTADMGSAQRLNIFEQLFGRGQAAALKLAAPGAVFDDLAKKMENAEGTARTLAKAMDDNLGGSFRLLNSALEGLQLDVFDAIQADIRIFTDALTVAVGDMSAFVKANSDAILTAAKLTATLIATGAAVTGIAIASKLAAAGIGLFNASFIAFRTTVLLTTKGVLLAGVAIKSIAAAVAVANGAIKLGIFWLTAKTAALGLMSQAAFAAAAAMNVLSLSISAVSLALVKFVALPVGVAIAGWYIGKAIADWTGLTEAIEVAYKWLFNIRELSQKETELELIKGWDKQLDEGIISLEEYQKRLKALEQTRQDISPEGDTVSPDTDRDQNTDRGVIPAGDQKEIEKEIKRIKEESARLALKTEYEGIELRRKQIDLAEQEAIVKANGSQELLDEIKKQYDLQRQVLNVELQRTKEKEKQAKAEQQAAEKAADAARAKLDAERRAAEIAQANAGVGTKIEDLKLELSYEGFELEFKRLKLERERALKSAQAAGENLGLVKEMYQLELDLLNRRVSADAESAAKEKQQQAAKDRASFLEQGIAKPDAVFGSFSAREVSGRANDAQRQQAIANAHLKNIEEYNRKMATEGMGLA